MNHPTTTAYPTAMPKAPKTGIIPKYAPPFLFLESIAILNDPIGPVLVILPKANSPIKPVHPNKVTKIKYGIKNAAPPN